MIDKNYKHLIASTSAVLALHNVNDTTGHSSPDLYRILLRRRDFDEPLLQGLLCRLMARYRTENPNWSEIALFRSLNMANQACLIPAGADVVLHDFGRAIALWSAAFEILIHPGIGGKADLSKVFELIENISWINKRLGYRHYRIKYRKQTTYRNLGCWLYQWIHSCRNAFMHGNPVEISTLKIPKSERPLFHHAAVLYRLALTSFLNLAWDELTPTSDDPEKLAGYAARKWQFQKPQLDFEEALRLCRISVEEQRQKRERQMNILRGRR